MAISLHFYSWGVVGVVGDVGGNAVFAKSTTTGGRGGKEDIKCISSLTWASASAAAAAERTSHTHTRMPEMRDTHTDTHFFIYLVHTSSTLT